MAITSVSKINTQIPRVSSVSSTPASPGAAALALRTQGPLPGQIDLQSRVLIAAAESDERTSLEKLASQWGHQVEVASDNDALLDAVGRAEPPAVLVLDSSLPGLNGLALLHHLHSQPSHRRSWIIVLTDTGGAIDRSETLVSRDAGVHTLLTKPDFLVRPIDEFELRVCIHSALKVRELYAEMAESVDAARFHATHDSLTGLWNRDSLLNSLFHESDRTQRLGSPLAYLLLDLDRFSHVNREYGYDSGDHVLRQLASRLGRCLRSYDLIGRCGEDELLIALPGASLEDARSMAIRLREAIAERPFDTLKGPVGLTASFGVAQSEGRSPLAVLREAESALATAKLAGGDCIRFFVPGPAVSDRTTTLPWQRIGRQESGRKSIAL